MEAKTKQKPHWLILHVRCVSPLWGQVILGSFAAEREYAHDGALRNYQREFENDVIDGEGLWLMETSTLHSKALMSWRRLSIEESGCFSYGRPIREG